MIIKNLSCRTFLESNLKKLNYEQLRFRRYLPQPKPLWKPVSIQKLFNIPPVTKMLEEDELILEKEETDYLNKYRSIQEYLNKEFTIPVLQGGSNIELKEEREEHQRLIEENNRENERIAKLREERLKNERELEELEDLKLELIKNEKYQVEKERAIKLILKEKERYPHYITKDKLKDVIETAIDHPTNYEFAIGLNGKIIYENKLNPYALKPSAVPETSDVLESNNNKELKLEAKKLYYD